MKKLLSTVALLVAVCASAQNLTLNPTEWKWLDDSRLYLSDGKSHHVVSGLSTVRECGKYEERYATFPVEPAGAVNLTWSPDSTMLAFTRANDLYVVDIATAAETRLTFDGSAVILNGYASWVYYEEIFGRPSKYRAFWWSPDSRKLAYYRFDDSEVPMFPIYSPFGQDGKLRETHYPKAGERNPEVRIGFIDVAAVRGGAAPVTVWADFDPSEDQYFGPPFWRSDSKAFYVTREPRIQNTLDLYAVSPADGSKQQIYHETYPTWLDWIDGMLFSDKGLYMVRAFETGWQQIYFLSYDGTELRRLTDGENWRVALVELDDDGSVYFTAERDSRVRQALYKVAPDGSISTLTDPSLHVSRVLFSPDKRHFAAAVSALDRPTEVWLYETRFAPQAWAARRKMAAGVDHAAKPGRKRYSTHFARYAFHFSTAEADGRVPSLIWMTTEDGFELPATILYPEGFDPSRQYPVHVDLYGGPDTPLVTDRWHPRYGRDEWMYEHGIIQVVADCRASGHSGRAGTDAIYKHLNDLEVKDFIAWAGYLKAFPYVRADKLGVEGFSFGGTMTAMLLFTAPDAYHYGIAGGGVYDWALYDSHYTERFMSTPQDNPDGYAKSRVLNYAAQYPVGAGQGDGSVMLKLTHGTGDDNVHFQNTLQLLDALHRAGRGFDFMIYPDGMHGYRGYQAAHFTASNRAFWQKYLLD